MAVVHLLLFLAFVAGPYMFTRILWRIRMPWRLRLIVLLAVPLALVGWLAARGDLTAITDPGAALIVLVMTLGWFLGASSIFRRRLIARAGENSQT
jgi:hypothetical protein